MSIDTEFSKYANQYDKYNIIQQIVSKALIREIDFQPKTILDLGCGSGQTYRYIDWEIDKYIGVDFSHKMCELHPKNDKCEIYCLDFDTQEFYDKFQNTKFDIVISSSALQWSKKFDKLVNFILSITNNFQAVLFTNNTYKTIFQITNQSSPILGIDQIKQALPKKSTLEKFEYKLIFNSKKELFRYIKNSGTRGENQLTYAQAKKLYQDYPFNFLEFEVVFIKVYKFI